MRQTPRSSLRLPLLLAAVALPLSAASVDAQYFGRNKVRYESFDFRILETPRFDIHFYPAESLATADAARMAERWYDRLSTMLDFQLPRKPIVFYADHPDFQQTNLGGGDIPQGTGGFTDGAKNRVVMPFTGVYAENDHVLGHELAHVFQYVMSDSALRGTNDGRSAGINSLPLWLIEGMAEYLSVGRDDPHTAMWMRDAVLRDDLPTIRQLSTDGRFFPYRYGQALWAYIGGKWGDRTVGTLYRAAVRDGFEPAIRRILAISHDSLSKEWHSTLKAVYGPVMEGRTSPADLGTRVLVGERRQRNTMELSPAISPDGRYVAFLSARNLVSIDLFVAELATGKIIAQLTTPNAESHFGSLSFISSSGSWSPDGRQLAYVTVDEGENRVALFDVARRKVVRTIDVPGIGAISDVAWGPDGRIALAGTRGGLSDLWLLDVESGRANQITNDRFAELHPAWSPDGKTLAFATDRGEGTSFDTLTYRPLRLATYSLETGMIRLLPTLGNAKHINPQFGAGGADIYFISDRDGFSDIYRLALSDSSFHQVTRLATGVSGISKLSPALTVAAATGHMVVSVFDDAGQLLHRLEPEATRGTPLNGGSASIAGILPPAEPVRESQVSRYLADATTGLPRDVDYPVSEYREGKLGLEYLGSPTIGVAVGGYGSGIGGSVQALFGDMLSDRLVGASLYGGGDLRDFGGEAVYLHQKGRMSWLAAASHTPYLLGGIGTVRDTTISTSGGQRMAQVYDQALARLYVDQASLTAQYPFSETRRVEFGLSANRQAYDIQSQSFLIMGNQLLGQLPTSGFDLPSLTYGQATLAYVGDYSTFGLTSPIAGGRFRLEASPLFGDLNMTTVLADYRRYLYMRPVTLAFRGLHYGRYGQDAESSQWMSPMFIGGNGLVRGYGYESFSAAECSAVPGNPYACPEFDRLVGSRIAVASAELRIPLLGPRGLAVIPFDFLPVEVSPFADAGTAWTSAESPTLTLGSTSASRIPVFSAGISSRVNLFGAMVLEMYYAKPFQRQGVGGQWGFVLAPGW